MQSDAARSLAGVSLVAGGVVVLLGFTTAEAFYPGYSTTTQTISALGAADGTEGSRAVFNGAMVLSGLLWTVAAYGVHHVYHDRPLTAVLVVTGLVGNVGVGVFPSQTGLPHTIAALAAFGGAGVSAFVAARLLRGSVRYLAVLLGVLELAALVAFVTLQGGTALGIGGLERWVAYLALAWMVAFGGYVLGDTPATKEAG